MDIEDIWYIEDTIDGNPVWGLFETQLLRKQLLNGIVAGLHREKIVEQVKAKGNYIAVLLFNDKLFVFSQHGKSKSTFYRAYLIGDDDVWTNDPTQEISVMRNPFGTLILSDGKLNIDSKDCSKIKTYNKNRHIICVNIESQQIADANVN